MQLPFYVELVDFSAERVLDLGCRASERDPVAAAGLLDHGEALRLQPCGDLLHVVLAQAEAVGILLGGDPLMVVRGFRVLLLGEELINGLLLSGGGHGRQGDGSQVHGRIDRALIELGLCQVVDVPFSGTVWPLFNAPEMRSGAAA